MSNPTSLYWLPPVDNWRKLFLPFFEGGGLIDDAVALARSRLDFLRTNALDAAVQSRFQSPPDSLGTKPIRLAMLGSSTLAHLHSATRVGGLRRRIWIETYENDYGQYLQELLDTRSPLHNFNPTTVLFALDGRHLLQAVGASADSNQATSEIDEALSRIRRAWQLAREAFGCPVLHQTTINVFPSLMGGNEHRLAGSRYEAVLTLNHLIRDAADQDGVDLLSVDHWIARHGIRAWHDPDLWHRSKQEVIPPAAPLWGDLVARILAAQQGRSFKALVLDLDNTIWGGVIGDDGLDGIVLGQGSALGEGFVAVQEYAKALSDRGVILSVASKNDRANALEPFQKHPEMVLKLTQIASFHADWNDKAKNIRAIANDLNIGLDSLVFLDDNPFERNLVRQELPMVAVPEVPDDPALVPQALSDAGYFESVGVTIEDRERTSQYQSNRAREELKTKATDIDGYLRSLEMRLIWRKLDSVGLARTVQLINKTNQFNLTTRRYTETDVVEIMNNPRAFGLQLRLLDRFGDNGIIGIVIGIRHDSALDVLIDTWLMSCRVLGRQVELATLDLVARHTLDLGAKRLIGEYIPTLKNGMVRDHYPKLGFTEFETDSEGRSKYFFDLQDFSPTNTFIHIEEGQT